MKTKERLVEINKTIDELLQLIESISQEQFNSIPFKGSWTAGQLAQHLVMSNSGFVEVMGGPEKVTDREPDEKEEKIKSDFLNFSIKMKSPEFIVPPERIYDKAILVTSISGIRDKLNVAAKTLEMSNTCLALELPEMGFLTRFEALCFMLYHTQRHIHQLKNIKEKLANLPSQHS